MAVRTQRRLITLAAVLLGAFIGWNLKPTGATREMSRGETNTAPGPTQDPPPCQNDSTPPIGQRSESPERMESSVAHVSARLDVKFPRDSAHQDCWIQLEDSVGNIVARWPLIDALATDGARFTAPDGAASLRATVYREHARGSRALMAETTAHRIGELAPGRWEAQFESAILNAECDTIPELPGYLWITCVSSANQFSHGKELHSWQGEALEWQLLPGEYHVEGQFTPRRVGDTHAPEPHEELAQVVGQLLVAPATVLLRPNQVEVVRLSPRVLRKWTEVNLGHEKLTGVRAFPARGWVRLFGSEQPTLVMYRTEEPMAARLDDRGKITEIEEGAGREWLVVGNRLFFAGDEASPSGSLPTMALVEFEGDKFAIVDASGFNALAGAALSASQITSDADRSLVNLTIEAADSENPPPQAKVSLTFVRRFGQVAVKFDHEMILQSGENRIVHPPSFECWITGIDGALDLVSPSTEETHDGRRIGPALTPGMRMDLRLRHNPN